MMRVLKHLRDFLDPDDMPWLPGRLHARTCLLLHKSRTVDVPDKPGVKRIEDTYHIFDENGTWIGEVTPDWWPSKASR